MFSKIMEGLRREAEMVSGSNAELLGNWNRNATDLTVGHGRYEYIQGESFYPFRKGLKESGLALGTVGLGAVAIPGVAAILGGFVASGGSVAGVGTSLTTLAGSIVALGTVSVGSVVLPGAMVIAVGVATVGAVAAGVSYLIPERESENAKTRRLEESARNNPDGFDEKISLKSWVTGAKNFVSKSLQESLLGVNNFPSTVEKTPNAQLSHVQTNFDKPEDPIYSEVRRLKEIMMSNKNQNQVRNRMS